MTLDEALQWMRLMTGWPARTIGAGLVAAGGVDPAGNPGVVTMEIVEETHG